MDGGGDDEEEETVEEKSFLEDARVQWVGRRLAPLLGLKADQWGAFVDDEAPQKLLADFLESRQPAFLAFYLPPAGGLAAGMKIPRSVRHKTVCIMKSTECIQIENCKNNLKFAELSGSPLEHVMAFLEEIVLPILSNKTSDGSWPQFTSQDMERHVELMKNKTYVMTGVMSGRTLLPIPTVAREIELHEMCPEKNQDSCARSVLHAIESMVIRWSHQIQDILERNSALHDCQPVPQNELTFWKERKDNLLSIYDQLKRPVIQQMTGILKAKMSSYYPTFQDIYKEVENALVEAQDIDLYLRTLQRHIQWLQEAEFPDTHILIPPLFHTICLIWSHSKFYNTPARIIILLQEFCNLFIDQAVSYLSPEDIMKTETEDALEQVQKALNILRTFKDAFFRQRKKMVLYFTNSQDIKLWDFEPQLVFSRFDQFLNRLEKIQDIFLTMLEFEKLEKLEFGGIKGKTLNDKISKLKEEFIEASNIFKENTYDPLDYNNLEFEEDYTDFKHKVLEFERCLGSIFCIAFLDCSGLESAFKISRANGYLQNGK